MSSPWYHNFPAPKVTPRSMTDVEVAALLLDKDKRAGADYIIVDVRRTDFGVLNYIVRTAINLPAQSFYPTRSTWVETFGNIPLVIFYCSSSNGRGPRCAGWFQDALNEVGDKVAEAVVLEGGINGWVEYQKDLADPVLQFPDS